MRVVFISNYLSHHQIPFSTAMYELTKGEYYFIQTEPMEEERVSMGWGVSDTEYPYLVKSYENYELALDLLKNSDVVIAGSAPRELVDIRIGTQKLLFRYQERAYRKGQWRAFSPRGFYYMHKAHGLSKRRNMFLLCAGAYVPCDYDIYKLYRNRMLKWGYFPPMNDLELDSILAKKSTDILEIVWCGRLIELKHPEMIISLARFLLQTRKDVPFHITMIGTGSGRKSVEDMIIENGLERVIDVVGPIKPGEVREYMMRANLFIATSDKREGWGAVINEAMESACCVVASHAMGAVPFLIEHNWNGVIFKSTDQDDLNKKIEILLNEKDNITVYGKRAYFTIENLWNAKTAAQRLYSISEGLLNTSEISFYENGPCSKAEVIRENKMFSMCMKGHQK